MYYIINLKEDAERRERMKVEMKNNGLSDYATIKFISADRPDENYDANNLWFPGELGVTLSQLKAVIHAERTYAKSNDRIPVFLEDDITFLRSPPTFTSDHFNHLHYVVIYLGGSPREQLKKTSISVRGRIVRNVHRWFDRSRYWYEGEFELAQVGKFTQACGWMMNPKYYEEFIDFVLNRITLPHPNCCFDNILNDFTLAQDDPSYTFYPRLVEQIDGYSTLRAGYREYQQMIANEWKKYRP